MNDGKVLDFTELKNKILKDKAVKMEEDTINTVISSQQKADEVIHQGLESFFEHLEEGVTGFITLSFNDADKTEPAVVISGEIDPLRAIGALHHVAGGFSYALHMEEFMKRLNDETNIGPIKSTISGTEEESGTQAGDSENDHPTE